MGSLEENNKIMSAVHSEVLLDLIVLRDQINSVLVKLRMAHSVNITNVDTSITSAAINLTLNMSGTTLTQIKSKARDTRFVAPRQIISVLLKNYTTLSLEKIGEIINRDHTTVMHSLKVMENARDTNDSLYADYQAVERILKGIIIELNIQT